MLELKFYGSPRGSTILYNQQGIEYEEICKVLADRGLERGTYYIERNGRLVSEKSILVEGYATVVPRVLGGKGGFGSMLRAIGAQIEKTTNREACRDLSGRRLRDINEEKRLKAWIEKQQLREEEEVARKKRKLEKLCAEPKHEFKDRRYEEERSCLTDRVGDAVEEGLKNAAAAAEVEEIEKKAKLEIKRSKGRKTILDEDFDSDELDGVSDSDDEKSNGSDEDSLKKESATTKENSSTDDGAGSSDESLATSRSDKNERTNTNDDSAKLPCVEVTRADCIAAKNLMEAASA